MLDNKIFFEILGKEFNVTFSYEYAPYDKDYFNERINLFVNKRKLGIFGLLSEFFKDVAYTVGACPNDAFYKESVKPSMRPFAGNPYEFALRETKALFIAGIKMRMINNNELDSDSITCEEAVKTFFS